MTNIIYRGSKNDGVTSTDLSSIEVPKSSIILNAPLKRTQIDGNFKALSDGLDGAVSAFSKSISNLTSTHSADIKALTSAHDADIAALTSAHSADISAINSKFDSWDKVSAGTSAKPVYFSAGKPVALSVTIGSASKPVYFKSGTITECGSSLAVDITGNAATASKINVTSAVGASTKPVYVNADGSIVECGNSLSVDISGNAATASKISVTKAIGNSTTPVFVAADGTITECSGFDTKVTTSAANSTKAYLTGTVSSATATGTLVFDTGVYLGTSAGELHASKFIGDLSGTATSATKATSADSATNATSATSAGKATSATNATSAASAGSASTASKISTTSAIGSTDVPVYVDSTGSVKSTGVSLSGLLKGVVNTGSFVNTGNSYFTIGDLAIAWITFDSTKQSFINGAITLSFPITFKAAPQFFVCPEYNPYGIISITSVRTNQLYLVASGLANNGGESGSNDVAGKIILIGKI